MAIRAVIVDISGTILNRQGHPVPNARALISQLQYWGIDVFFATNNPACAILLQRTFDLEWSKFLFPQRVGGKKGTKQFVNYVCSSLELPSNAILYIGDAMHDFYEAHNSNVLFFSATWANSALHCGVPVNSPAEFIAIVQTFFLKESLWYYRIEGKDGLGRAVMMRALLDSDIPKITGITPFIKANGNMNGKSIKGFQSDRYLSLHLLASIYLEGLHVRGEGIWCLYPGHDGQYGAILDNFLIMTTHLFRDQSRQQLIVRYVAAPSSSQTRINHGIPTIDTQLQTIYLDPAVRTEIMYRPVIVLDDFTTDAYGFETARNFLLNAGAGSVTSIAVGKYGKAYAALYPKPETHWDSFQPTSLRSEDFSFTGIAGQIDRDALRSF